MWLNRVFTWIESHVDAFAPYTETVPDKRPWRYFINEALTLGPILWIAAAAGTLVALLELGLIWYAGRLVDLMAAGPETFWADYGTEVLLATLLLVFLRPIAVTFSSMVNFSGISTHLLPQSRWRAHRWMLGQPVGFFQNDFAGRLSNRVLKLGNATEDGVFIVFEAFWSSAMFAVVTVLLMLQMSVWLAVPVTIWIIVFTAVVIWFGPKTAVYAQKFSGAESRVSGRIVDSYTNIETIKLFARDEDETRYVLSAMKRVQLRFGALMRFFAVQTGAMAIFNAFALLVIIGPALWLWTNGALTIGEVAAAIAMALRLNMMTGWIIWMTVRVFEHLGDIAESLESVAVPHSVTDKPGAPAIQIKQGQIDFQGVAHHYGRRIGGLNGVDLSIKGGERVGLVGPSGAGKSTLVNLLLRLRDAEEGEIRIDGQNIADVQQQSLRGAIGMVTQDTSLLHRSVRQNLMYGRPEATEDEMIAATMQAQAHEFIMELEDNKGRQGYNALVGERGVKLSGGQRQRIALARVILKDAPILLLDEATSALDSEVEAAIQSALQEMMEGKTVIAIAHRLSTIAQMDRIVVMQDGRVVEDGAHDALVSAGGQYARLWSRQSGGFIGRDAAE
ncbi:MAG: ABC transporter ATP-binding protein [Pseudomonadota bacterium]